MYVHVEMLIHTLYAYVCVCVCVSNIVTSFEPGCQNTHMPVCICIGVEIKMYMSISCMHVCARVYITVNNMTPRRRSTLSITTTTQSSWLWSWSSWRRDRVGKISLCSKTESNLTLLYTPMHAGIHARVHPSIAPSIHPSIHSSIHPYK